MLFNLLFIIILSFFNMLIMEKLMIFHMDVSPWPLSTFFFIVILLKFINILVCYRRNLILLNFNKIRVQKKFYPNPQEIMQIYNTIRYFAPLVVRRGNCKRSYAEVMLNNGNKEEHKQESVIIFDVEHNQSYYAREYEVQVDGIKIREDKEITDSIDQLVIEKSNEIVEEISKECKISEEQVEIINEGIKNFKNNNENEIVKYSNTIGIQKNNLTSSSINDSIFIHKTSKFGVNTYLYQKKGIIQINRNETDYIRSMSEIAIDCKDNKGLQSYNIGDEKHQALGLEIMKGIGGYNNIQYYNEIKTKQEMLQFLVQTYIILKKNIK